MLDRLSPPGMPADIDVDGTVVITDAALHTTIYTWDKIARRGDSIAVGIGFKYI